MSNVYFVMASTAEWQRVKIGKANDVAKRIAALQTGCPMQLKLLGVIRIGNERAAAQIEANLHSKFSGYAIGGEWFELTAPLRDYITATCNGDDAGAAQAISWAARQMRKRVREKLKYHRALR